MTQDPIDIMADALSIFIQFVTQLMGIAFLNNYCRELFPKGELVLTASGKVLFQTDSPEEKAQKFLEVVAQKIIDGFGPDYVLRLFQRLYAAVDKKYQGGTEPLKVFLQIIPAGFLEEEKKKLFSEIARGHWKAVF